MNWNLKRAIYEDHRSQVNIGIEAKIGEIRLSQIITGKVEPKPKEKKALSEVLRIGQEQLFSKGNEPFFRGEKSRRTAAATV